MKSELMDLSLNRTKSVTDSENQHAYFLSIVTALVNPTFKKMYVLFGILHTFAQITPE